MSDYNSSLPIRTENAGDVISKIADATIPSRQLTVNADGSVNITDNGASITVDGSVTVTATNLDIRDLAFATDKVDVSGSSVTVTATDLDIRNLAASQDNVAISDGTDTLGINADGSINVSFTAGAEIKITDGTDDLAINADGSLNAVVTATNLDIRDLTHVSDSIKVGDGTDFLAVNADGSINVVVTDSTPGTAVNDYDTTVAVAGGASDSHTYTSTGNFYLTQIESSASGKMKIEVQVNGVTKFVQFNSTANTNMNIQLSQPLLATTGQTVVVIRTNRDNQAQDVYSTISGYIA